MSRVTAIIAEFNPFHNGHADLLNELRAKDPDARIIVLMSGNFVQRGEPAVMDKHRRVRAALSAGADLVLELPVLYSIAPAELYARGAIHTLNALGIVDRIAFGSESGDLTALQYAADELSGSQTQDPVFHDIMTSFLRSGMTYPKAFSASVRSLSPGEAREDIVRLMEDPNNLLGIEYLKSLRQTDSRIEPLTIRRSPQSDRILSASEIRKVIHDAGLPEERKGLLSQLSSVMPEGSFRELQAITGVPDDPDGIVERPVFSDDLSGILSYCLTMSDPDGYVDFADINEDLANRIENCRLQCHGFEQFAALVKTKSTTLARVRRCLIQLILGLKRDLREEMLDRRATVIRVLGFRGAARELLKQIGAHASAPMILRGTDYRKVLEDNDLRPLVRLDLKANALYDQLAILSGERVPEAAKPPVIME